MTGLLDVLGIALIGFLGALSVRGISSGIVGDRTSKVLEILKIQQFTFQSQVAVLGFLAVGLLILKTILTLILNRKFLRFISAKAAEVSGDLFTQIIRLPYDKYKHISGNEILYKVTIGVNAIYLGIFVSATSIIVDSLMVSLMFSALLIADSTVALSALLFFTMIALVSHKSISSKTARLSAKHYDESLECNNLIVESANLYRENYIHNTENFTVENVRRKRMQLSNTLSDLTFLPTISKHLIETFVLIAALAIGAFQFASKDAVHAVATLSMFLAASSRIAPSVIRLQQGFAQIQANLGTALPALEDLLQESSLRAFGDVDLNNLWEYEGFTPQVEISGLSFKYSEHMVPTLRNISFTVKAGETVAIVGPSGSGKSTLTDCILGLLNPTAGSVHISSGTPREAITRWPGSISYVSQSVFISNGTIAENICLGLPKEFISEEKVMEALSTSQLEKLPNYEGKISEFHVGENGSKLSGGQRQRIGLARALYTKPTLLVLDEASSALDGTTESDLIEALRALKGEVTVIMIAHRLSSVKYADKVLYLEDGTMRAFGTLLEVRSQIPEFDREFHE